MTDETLEDLEDSVLSLCQDDNIDELSMTPSDEDYHELLEDVMALCDSEIVAKEEDSKVHGLAAWLKTTYKIHIHTNGHHCVPCCDPTQNHFYTEESNCLPSQISDDSVLVIHTEADGFARGNDAELKQIRLLPLHESTPSKVFHANSDKGGVYETEAKLGNKDSTSLKLAAPLASLETNAENTCISSESTKEKLETDAVSADASVSKSNLSHAGVITSIIGNSAGNYEARECTNAKQNKSVIEGVQDELPGKSNTLPKTNLNINFLSYNASNEFGTERRTTGKENDCVVGSADKKGNLPLNGQLNVSSIASSETTRCIPREGMDEVFQHPSDFGISKLPSENLSSSNLISLSNPSCTHSTRDIHKPTSSCSNTNSNISSNEIIAALTSNGKQGCRPMSVTDACTSGYDHSTDSCKLRKAESEGVCFVISSVPTTEKQCSSSKVEDTAIKCIPTDGDAISTSSRTDSSLVVPPKDVGGIINVLSKPAASLKLVNFNSAQTQKKASPKGNRKHDSSSSLSISVNYSVTNKERSESERAVKSHVDSGFTVSSIEVGSSIKEIDNRMGNFTQPDSRFTTSVSEGKSLPTHLAHTQVATANITSHYQQECRFDTKDIGKELPPLKISYTQGQNIPVLVSQSIRAHTVSQMQERFSESFENTVGQVSKFPHYGKPSASLSSPVATYVSETCTHRRDDARLSLTEGLDFSLGLLQSVQGFNSINTSSASSLSSTHFENGFSTSNQPLLKPIHSAASLNTLQFNGFAVPNSQPAIPVCEQSTSVAALFERNLSENQISCSATAARDSLPPSFNSDFVSDDPNENKDNSNPNWDVLRMLATDDDRYRAVRQRWRNILIPDPCIDLSSQTFREGRLHGSPSGSLSAAAPASRKRPASDCNLQSQAKRCRREVSCTERFDSQLNRLEKFFEVRRNKMNQDFERNRCNLMRAVQMSERCMEQQSYDGCTSLFNRYLSRHQFACDSLANLEESHKRKLEDVTHEFQSSAKKLRTARHEVLIFHAFYANLKNSTNANEDTTKLNRNVQQEMYECDTMYELYSRFYG